MELLIFIMILPLAAFGISVFIETLKKPKEINNKEIRSEPLLKFRVQD